MKYDWFIYFIIALMSLLTSIILFQKNLYAETNTVSSTVVTNSTPPTANAPVIANSNSDICKVGVGGSVQNNVLGVATGILVDDELCQLLKLSRSQYSYGMKVSAVALLCQDPRVWTSMMDAGTPCPVKGLIGAEAAAYWEENPNEIPDGSRYKLEYLQAKVIEEKPEGDFDDIKNFGLMALSLLLLF